MTATAPRPTPAGGRRTRLSPDERRSQLLDLGVRLLATRPLDEISIDLLAEQAGISRGLLYHYFGSKTDFHEAVVRRAADDLIAQTAPPGTGDPVERLRVSMDAYVAYVEANHEGYLSMVKAAVGGQESLRRIYDEARASLTDRLFTEGSRQGLLSDTPLHRLVVDGWAAMVEALVLDWVAEPHGVTRAEVLAVVGGSLPRLVEGLPG